MFEIWKGKEVGDQLRTGMRRAPRLVLLMTNRDEGDKWHMGRMIKAENTD